MLIRELAAAFTLAATLSFSAAAAAQRPEDVAAAATAFREGQSAQLAGEYARAAELFELADDSAPSPAALRSAIRNRQAAGHPARAASLAAEAIERYPGDAETRTLADAVLAELRGSVGEVRVRCALECSVAIDGRTVREHAATAFDLFVDPGTHALVASWSGREPVTRSFDATAGVATELELDAPPLVTATEPDPVSEPEPEPEPTPAPARGGGGISPAVFGTGAGLTAVGAGLVVWSGLDVFSARDAYTATPTEAGYNDGLGRETRTNVLIGVTGAFAAATLVVAFFTDFGGGSVEGGTAANVVPTVVVTPDGVSVGAGGSF